MRASSSFLIALFVIIPFSGCFGGETPADTSVSPSASATSTAPVGNETESENTPPVGSFGAAVREGVVPLLVNFTLNGTDADADNLSWTLDADGDGEADRDGANASFPLETNFTYEAAGLYNVTYMLSDGTDSASYNLTINVTAGLATTPQQDYKFTGTVSGTWNPATGYSSADVFHPFMVTDHMAKMVASISEGDTAPDLDYALIDPKGEVAASAAGTFPVDGTEEPDLTVEEPALGEWKVRVRAAVAQNGAYTVEVKFS